MKINWHSPNQIESREFKCGYCGNVVASNQGYFEGTPGSRIRIYICPHCTEPTYFSIDGQVPGVTPGDEVDQLPEQIESLYREARNAVSVGAFTASVLTCRKLLMNISVNQGASEGQSFLSYVEHLASQGFVPPNGRGWVDHIRKKGNEANHEIVLMSQKDAEELISFSEMLLKFIYEFPSKIPSPPPAT